MKEFGIVTKLNNSNATVKVDKKDECSKCGMCLFPKGASNIEFNAKNELGAKVGDKVEIEKENDAKLFGATLVFLVPLLLIVLSAFITYVFLKNEIWLLILSVIFIVLWYTILAVIDKKLKKLVKFSSVIVEIKEKN